jgi:hypothetical protein
LWNKFKSVFGIKEENNLEDFAYKYQTFIARVFELDAEEARPLALSVLENPQVFECTSSDAPVNTLITFPPTLNEVAVKSDRIDWMLGVAYIDLRNTNRSQWRRDMWVIGEELNGAQLLFLEGDDEIILSEGMTEEGDYRDEIFPSIYHWILVRSYGFVHIP